MIFAKLGALVQGRQKARLYAKRALQLFSEVHRLISELRRKSRYFEPGVAHIVVVVQIRRQLVVELALGVGLVVAPRWAQWTWVATIGPKRPNRVRSSRVNRRICLLASQGMLG